MEIFVAIALSFLFLLPEGLAALFFMWIGGETMQDISHLGVRVAEKVKAKEIEEARALCSTRSMRDWYPARVLVKIMDRQTPEGMYEERALAEAEITKRLAKSPVRNSMILVYLFITLVYVGLGFLAGGVPWAWGVLGFAYLCALGIPVFPFLVIKGLRLSLEEFKDELEEAYDAIVAWKQEI